MKNIVFITLLSGFYLTSFAQKSIRTVQKHKHALELIQKTKPRYSKGLAAPVCLKDSSVELTWDTINNVWLNNYRSLFAYNTQSNLFTETDYNINTPLTAWDKNSKSVLTYNSQNTLTLTLSYQWDLATSTWFATGRSTYTYSPANDLLVQLQESRDTTTHTWVGDFRTTYTYNATHSVTVEIGEYYSSNVWTNGYKSTNAYNANSNLTNNIFYFWNMGTSNWEPSDQTVFTYVSGNNPSSGIATQWNTSTTAWDNYAKYTYTFSGNNLTYELDQVWDSGSSSWQNYGNYAFTYDVNNNETSVLEQQWMPVTSIWRNSYKEFMYYTCQSTVGLGRLVGSAVKFDVYPSPAFSEIHINTELEFSSLHILSLGGQEVYNSKQDSKIVSVSQLEKGIYFIQLFGKNGDLMATKKFVKN